MKATLLLKSDHKQILRALSVLEEMVARVQLGARPDATDVRGVVDFLNGFGDYHHQGREEFVVFPALLRDRGQKNYKELAGMIYEHNRQRSLLEGLQDSLLTRKTADFIYCATTLIKILREHVREEEDVLFPLIDAMFSPSEDERVAQGMTAYGR